MSKRKVTPDENLEAQFTFADYVTDERGYFDKKSKVNWPKSQWQHLSNMCARADVKVTYRFYNQTFVFHLKVDDDITIQLCYSHTFYDMYTKIK